MDFKARYQYNSKTDLLGRGGFATVYKANDTLLNRVVALKFFTNSSGSNKHTLIQEISRAITLEHPNLCRYYDAAVLESANLHGEIENTEVGVMEYIDSGELKFYLSKNPVHIDKLLTDVLQGLSYLHSRGIIHRDLKPQNILVKSTPQGPIAKITDFGISKTVSTGNTSSSQLMGTVEYMAPEQFSPAKYGLNGRIGTNLDLWSFGLMVYELKTGETMFGSRGGQSSAEQVMSNILNDNLVEEKIKQLPLKYREVVSRCLVKDAKQRAQNADELIDLLNNKTVVTPADQGSETVVLPKVEVEKLTVPSPDSLETKIIDSTKEPKSAAANPVINKIKDQPKKKFNPILLAIPILIIVALVAWFWLSSNTNTNAAKAVAVNSDSVKYKLATAEYEKGDYPAALNALGSISNKSDTSVKKLQGDCWYGTGKASYDKKDYSDALQWFNKGAATGNAKSECMIGTMYFQGQGVAKDDDAAFGWYFKSAEQYNEVAMYALGMFYADGDGVQANKKEAKKYLTWVVNNAKDPDVVQAATNKLKSLD